MSDWHGLYSEGWQGEITPEAFSHPAKFSRGLIRRIYQHMIEEGWLHEGDCVVDPFGGVALGGLDAMANGLFWYGVELEPRFVLLGCQNIALWNARYRGKLPHWGTATLLQGDSRNLAQIVANAGACVSSPPFTDVKNVSHSGMVQKWCEQNGRDPQTGSRTATVDGYGSTPGNLGNLPAGSLGAALSSPPYAESAHNGGDDPHPEHVKGGEIHLPGIAGAVASPPYAESMNREGGIDPAKSDYIGGPHSQMNNSDTRYGSTPGQLGAMRAEGYEAAVSSPPFENGQPQQDKTFTTPHDSLNRKMGEYGQSDGQLGIETGDTFWTAARTIVEQTYAVLRPGAHACWVVKSYVKNKAIVPFPEQWQALCEAVGFETVHVHRAWLVEDRGTQFDLEGNGHKREVQRKSFFRRLAEKHGSPRIDFEVVLCMIKPLEVG